jgi:hypothetical protein
LPPWLIAVIVVVVVVVIGVAVGVPLGLKYAPPAGPATKPSAASVPPAQPGRPQPSGSAQAMNTNLPGGFRRPVWGTARALE